MLALLPALLVACTHPKDESPPGTPPPPEPGPLEVGVARVRMPVPLGIGTVGYGGFATPADPTPFAEKYPGTTRIHAHPDFRALAISRGPGFELVFLRSDTVGIFEHMRRAVVLELKARLGRDLDHALIIGATHTHSGPGRVLDVGGPFELIADVFLPEFYDRMVGAMADAVEQSLADLKPGRVGTAFAYTDAGHNDRRCEDGEDHENGALPMVAVEQEGTVRGLLVAYAVHGTVLGIDDLTLSEDVSGGIESAIEDRFDHDVLVAQMNAWGADMSPDDPVVPEQAGYEPPDGYEQIQRVGQAVADAVEATIPDLVWQDEPDIALQTNRVAVGREALGYTGDEFPYPFGGVYCSSANDDCDLATVESGLDHACLPFSAEFSAPDRTEMSRGRLGDLSIVTFPGEPGTLLAEQVLDRIGEDQVLFLGYAQDYIGYSILEDDWWQGGYEASGALWGPKQGQYLADNAVAGWTAWAAGDDPGGPEPIEPFDVDEYTPYAGPDPVAFGTVITDVGASYGATDLVTLTVAGADPWWGAPVATLVHAADGSPVLRPNGRPVDSDGQAFWIDLATTPPYADGIDVPTRRFEWTFSLPAKATIVGAVPPLLGDYRLSVSLPDGVGGTEVVESGTFTIGG